LVRRPITVLAVNHRRYRRTGVGELLHHRTAYAADATAGASDEEVEFAVGHLMAHSARRITHDAFAGGFSRWRATVSR
jgi:hypothetical protein